MTPFSTGRTGVSPIAEAAALAAGFIGIAVLTAGHGVWLRVNNPTIAALSFLLIVLLVAAASTRRVAIVTSLVAFLFFNYYFLPPLGTWAIADPQNWVALFTLLAVSIIASHLSSQVRYRERDAQLKSALLASLDHDLKTPLTAATLAANNLKASWLTADQRDEQLEIVRSELARLNHLFEEVMDMARIESKAIAAEFEWVHPADIVEAAARQAEKALAGHTLDVHTAPAQTLVRLDPRLTSAALAHLLENAGQYSPPGSPVHVSVSLSRNELSIAVRDQGPGLSASESEHVFERFYRGSKARQRRFGTGMGLAITRGLLAAQNGNVRAENDTRGGAVFTLVVPVHQRACAALEET